MLSVRTTAAAARTHFPSSSSISNPLCRRRHSSALLRISNPRFPTSIRIIMSSSSSAANSQSDHSSSKQIIIEHFVLFKVKPDADPSAVSAMITNLNSLGSLDQVLHLSAGPVHRCRSKSSLTFTHMLHSRYRSKSDSISYAEHPEHIRVVSNFVKPVVDDIMAVDWVADDFPGDAKVSPGSALRLTMLKLKEDSDREKEEEVLKIVSEGIKDKFPSIEQMTAGVNFSPLRAKGYSICSIAVFKGVKELEEEVLDSELEKDKVRDFLDGVVVLDYAVQAVAA